ncbi:hypothetical protein FF38_07034 [Lucilia cuprina]|uniref:Uncharacterized protein n=1 Tax=Lucilia cuprina TaxID=7375 RepID=A0A0L0BL56_LUCCU|nr:hypothetical protein FF38_07034 [Lucilia cuprina]
MQPHIELRLFSRFGLTHIHHDTPINGSTIIQAENLFRGFLDPVVLDFKSQTSAKTQQIKRCSWETKAARNKTTIKRLYSYVQTQAKPAYRECSTPGKEHHQRLTTLGVVSTDVSPSPVKYLLAYSPNLATVLMTYNTLMYSQFSPSAVSVISLSCKNALKEPCPVSMKPNLKPKPSEAEIQSRSRSGSPFFILKALPRRNTSQCHTQQALKSIS